MELHCDHCPCFCSAEYIIEYIFPLEKNQRVDSFYLFFSITSVQPFDGETKVVTSDWY